MKNFKIRVRFGAVAIFLSITFVATITFVANIIGTSEGQSSFTVEYDTDRRFGDYQSFETNETSHMVCQNACAADAKCLAYTYVKHWQQYPAKCWLKDSVPRGESGLTCCVSGVKRTGGGGAMSFAGSWRAYGWEFIQITQDGTSVTGKYSDYTGDRYPKGSFTGTVRGEKVYFSWRNLDGAVGEGVLYPFDNGRRWGLRYCVGSGCNAETSDKYSEAFRQ